MITYQQLIRSPRVYSDEKMTLRPQKGGMKRPGDSSLADDDLVDEDETALRTSFCVIPYIAGLDIT